MLIHIPNLAAGAFLCYFPLMSQDLGRLLLRIAVGGLMLFHGVNKLRKGISGVSAEVAAEGLPSLLAYGVYIGEVIAPLFVLIGLWTRPSALVIAVNMVVAVWLAHADAVFALGKGGAWGIELQALYFFGALALALLGTGRYAVMNGTSRWS
jgi:putative oxidoreductase